MMPKPKQSKSNNNFKNEVNQMSSERVLYESRPNMILYSDNFIFKIIVLFFLVFMFSPILALVYRIQGTLQSNYQVSFVNMTYIAEGILFLCIFIIIVKLILDYLDWNNTLYTLTDKRIIIKRGLFNKEKISMPYTKVQDIDVSQSIMERLLSAGDIVIYGGRDNAETILDEVSNPRDVEEIILNQVNNLNYSYNQNQYINAYNNAGYVNDNDINSENGSNSYINNSYGRDNNYNSQYDKKQHNEYVKSKSKSDVRYSNNYDGSYDEYDSTNNQDYDYVDDEDFEEYNVESKKHKSKNNSNTHYFNTNDNLKRSSIKNNTYEKENKNNKFDKEELLSLNKRKFKKS